MRARVSLKVLGGKLCCRVRLGERGLSIPRAVGILQALAVSWLLSVSSVLRPLMSKRANVPRLITSPVVCTVTLGAFNPWVHE